MTDTVKAKEIIKHSFLIVLSSGPSIPCDPDELTNILDGLESGSIVQLRQGIFNPSFFVSIVQDDKRKTEFLENTKYSDERSMQLRAAGMRPLSDLFHAAVSVQGLLPNNGPHSLSMGEIIKHTQP